MQQITVVIPETSITIPEEEFNFNDLERKIWQRQMQQGCGILEKALEELDNLLAAERKAGLENKGFRPKYLSSLFGNLLYRRRAYYDDQKNFRYLLDEKIGLEKAQQTSNSRAKLETILAFNRSYRSVADTLHFLLGNSRSFEAIRQQVLTIGRKLVVEEEKTVRNLLEDTGPVDSAAATRPFAVLEADETFINLQGESQKRGAVKLGIGYSGWGQRYAAGKGKSFGLLQKFVCLGIEEGEKFCGRFSLLANRRLNLDNVKHVIIGGDGATWISQTLAGYFVNSTYQLCKFHLNQAIKRVFATNKKLQRHLKEKLRADQINGALNFLRTIAFRVDRRGREKVYELINYIDHNRHGINSIKKLKKKLNKEEKAQLRCTGAIEGNIDKVICNRFKKRGMRWSIFGATCLLKVGEKICNGEWEAWWRQTKGFQTVNLPSQAAAETKRKYCRVMGRAKTNIWGDYLEHSLPALHGPAQDRTWVEWLKGKMQLVEPA